MEVSEVWLDGERVDFQGPPPSSPSEIWALLDQHLAGMDRLLVEMRVDGEEWNEDISYPDRSYGKIEASSRSELENLKFAAAELIGKRETIESLWESTSRDSLNLGWQDFQAKMAQTLGGTQPLIENCGLLIQFASLKSLPWHDSLKIASESLNVEMGRAMDAFESSNCILISDIAAFDIPKVLGDVFQALSLIVGEDGSTR